MGDYRSKSYGDGRMQMQPYYGPRPTSNPHDIRSYSSSFDASYGLPPPLATQMGGMKDLKLKKSKTSIVSSWGFNDPELQRKKRVASYKVYSVEDKVKGSLRKSFKWIKDRYNHVVYGWR